MLTEGMILSLGLCGVLSLIGFRFRSLPLIVMSSLGLTILSLDLIQMDSGMLNPALMWLIAFGQVLACRWSE